MTEKNILKQSGNSGESFAEYVAQKIRQDILDGHLFPGDRIREVELASQLQVSRTPVREAFRVLQSEGFLVYNSGCGVMVSSVDMETVKQTWEVRSILESSAAAKASRVITESQLGELVELQKTMESLSYFDPREFTELDTQLHMLIACASGNAKLEETIRHLWLTSGSARVFSTCSPAFGEKRSRDSCVEHSRVVKAIQMGDEILAKRYMEIHFTQSIESIKENFNFLGKSKQ